MSNDATIRENTRETLSDWAEWNWTSSDGIAIIPEGVIRDILIAIGNDFPIPDFTKKYREDICMLAGGSEDRKILAAERMWEKLWLEEEGLPYLPLIRILAKQEAKSRMYDGYRDHVIHSVWVYLLGLAVYRQIPVIRETMLQTFGRESDFLTAWKIAALFHDIGYTFDMGVDDEDRFLSPLLEEIAVFIKYPLREYLEIRGFNLSESEERELARISRRHNPFDPNLNDLEKPADSADNYLLDRIEPLAIPTDLAQDGQSTPLQNYYRFAQNIKPVIRSRFRDHGILSALILLYMFDRLDHSLVSLKGVELPPVLNRKTRRQLAAMLDTGGTVFTDTLKPMVFQAAAAIALHNIDTRHWDMDKSKQAPYSLSLEDFCITLSETPLAFLLALCDVVQCWGRLKRGYVADDADLSVPSQKVRVRFENDTIIWEVADEPVNPKEEIQQMADYLAVSEDRNLTDVITHIPPSEPPGNGHGDPAGNRNKIFICYAEDDQEIAMRVYHFLKSKGWSPWIDEEDLFPGQVRSHAIPQAVQASDYFIVLLSVNSVSGSGHFNKEQRMALDIFKMHPEGEVFIIPVRIEPCETSFPEIQGIKPVDLFPSFEGGLNKLLKALAFYANRSS